MKHHAEEDFPSKDHLFWEQVLGTAWMWAAGLGAASPEVPGTS